MLCQLPDVVTIDYGLNDRRIGLQRAEAAWRDMIRAAKERGVKVILLTRTPDLGAKLDDPHDPLNEQAAQQVMEGAPPVEWLRHAVAVDSAATQREAGQAPRRFGAGRRGWLRVVKVEERGSRGFAPELPRGGCKHGAGIGLIGTLWSVR